MPFRSIGRSAPSSPGGSSRDCIKHTHNLIPYFFFPPICGGSTHVSRFVFGPSILWHILHSFGLMPSPSFFFFHPSSCLLRCTSQARRRTHFWQVSHLMRWSWRIEPGKQRDLTASSNLKSRHTDTFLKHRVIQMRKCLQFIVLVNNTSYGFSFPALSFVQTDPPGIGFLFVFSLLFALGCLSSRCRVLSCFQRLRSSAKVAPQ